MPRKTRVREHSRSNAGKVREHSRGTADPRENFVKEYRNSTPRELDSIDPDEIAVYFDPALDRSSPKAVLIENIELPLVYAASDVDGDYFVSKGKWHGHPVEVRIIHESYFPGHPDADDRGTVASQVHGFEVYGWQGRRQVNLKARRPGGGTIEVWVGED
jgi:hypothetical protein